MKSFQKISMSIFIFCFFFVYKTQALENNTMIPLSQIIDQHIIIGGRGITYNQSDFKEIFTVGSPGGILLFDYDSPSKGSTPRNITTKEQLKNLVRDLKKQGDVEAFIAIDQEGGAVNRLKSKYGFSVTTPNAKTLEWVTLGMLRSYLGAMVIQLEDVGITLNFGTVVDLDYGVKSKGIGLFKRAFSRNPDKVIIFGRESLIAHKKFSILGTLKHYPGHGSAHIDSHTGLPTVNSAYKKNEEKPFKALSQEADAIMVGHLIDTTIDTTTPASLSKKHIDYIRNTLGFKGILITDDLEMDAILHTHTIEESAFQALQAGNTMIILSNNMKTYDPQLFEKVRTSLIKKVQSKELDEKKLRESYAKIIELKKRYNLRTTK